MLTTILIALSLSMDAFAVSVSAGAGAQRTRAVHILRGSLCFGLFQFCMPLAGWYLGMGFMRYIEEVDHWIAFGLLALIGGNMIRESLFRRKSPEAGSAGTGGPVSGGIRGLGALLLLGAATSIDALAVGVSFSVISRNIWESAAVIGGVTFLVCCAGFEFGRRIGRVFERGARIAGGIILMGIGLKILAEHLGKR
ncbi:MAG: manganese efflux pump MntP family protein [Treponema sp.]|jgi:putative Mn2+ efflux pump MntP|nr:manganese efflux pump MntP family protein [Treponema sp.]